jgi:hypothetical protein
VLLEAARFVCLGPLMERTSASATHAATTHDAATRRRLPCRGSPRREAVIRRIIPSASSCTYPASCRGSMASMTASRSGMRFTFCDRLGVFSLVAHVRCDVGRTWRFDRLEELEESPLCSRHPGACRVAGDAEHESNAFDVKAIPEDEREDLAIWSGQGLHRRVGSEFCDSYVLCGRSRERRAHLPLVEDASAIRTLRVAKDVPCHPNDPRELSRVFGNVSKSPPHHGHRLFHEIIELILREWRETPPEIVGNGAAVSGNKSPEAEFVSDIHGVVCPIKPDSYEEALHPPHVDCTEGAFAVPALPRSDLRTSKQIERRGVSRCA